MTKVARKETTASPSRVWDVLADGWSYATWVVGASRIRKVDATWPAVGSRIHHSVGLWPVLLDDRTEVLSATPERELVLRARAWAFGQAEIRLTIEPASGGGSTITMSEHVVSGLPSMLPEFVQESAVWPRNRECLSRLTLLAQRATPSGPAR
ncbi:MULTISPECIES: SRPBCC family protein [unclassified Rhodococcus (in: high G+C Gram-positive bacteria)]|uniref:SRPBCC family protein n=1 Tax=unclassified Rhodococcus (in: high G+C Gram-positive bacteria) TaxID=192944 RepID=UPI00146B06C8|nr:SRPBCC family protein [Rhodococcus sp. 105337]NME77669.1 SRPBCC family protein [Rhodococcus sp. 105337]